MCRFLLRFLHSDLLQQCVYRSRRWSTCTKSPSLEFLAVPGSGDMCWVKNPSRYAEELPPADHPAGRLTWNQDIFHQSSTDNFIRFKSSTEIQSLSQIERFNRSGLAVAVCLSYIHVAALPETWTRLSRWFNHVDRVYFQGQMALLVTNSLSCSRPVCGATGARTVPQFRVFTFNCQETGRSLDD